MRKLKIVFYVATSEVTYLTMSVTAGKPCRGHIPSARGAPAAVNVGDNKIVACSIATEQ